MDSLYINIFTASDNNLDHPYARIYGTSIPPIILGAIAIIGSVLQLVRNRQYPLRYAFIFLAAAFSVISRSLLVAIIYGRLDIFSGIFASSAFFYLYVPFLYCVFFEVCRTTINYQLQQQQDATTATNEKITTAASSFGRFNLRKLYPTYFAYFYTFVYVITTAVWGGMMPAAFYNLFYNLQNLVGFEKLAALHKLVALNDVGHFVIYGIWVYVLCMIIQLLIGYRQLRPILLTLSVYLFAVLVSTIVNTVVPSIDANIAEQAVADIVQLCLVLILGNMSLVYAGLWCSTRYWTFGNQQVKHLPLVYKYSA